ncbi:MAG TPA: GNAT family N-acetyltransferase [Bacteroidales bacterium]|nr:GNAT family N-acetyltransferase [Bacteroidales bacterium]
MEVRTLKPEDYPEWDKFVNLSPQGDIFDYSWWLDTVTPKFEINALYENGKIVAGMPLAYDEYGRINEPPLTRTLGILFTPGKDKKSSSNQRKWAALLVNHMPVGKVAQFCTHHNFIDWLPFKWSGFKQTTRYTYLIDYSGKEESDLWNGLNRGKKSIINKASKNGVRVVESDDPAVAYAFLEKSYKRQGLNVRYTKDILIRLDKVIKRNIHRIILNATGSDGSVHASIYVAWNNRSAYYLLSGSDPDKRHLGGHTLVLWNAIRSLRSKSEYFNFGGSDIRNIEQHVSGFGGILTPYFHIYNDKVLHSTDPHYHFDNLMYHLTGLIKASVMRLFRN